ncbi:MAG: DUF421 domain-containing protein [Erysipelotrichaceae bacterium]
MNEYIILVLKCIMFYFVIILALRIMGKREVGELSIFDIVIYLVMSELLALSISESNNSVLKSLIPIFTLALLQILLSLMLLKWRKLRNIVEGEPVMIIHNGHINQKLMKKNRYSIDDLMAQIRDKNLSSPSEVAFALLENSGTLSIISKDNCKVRHPSPVISDGELDTKILTALKLNEQWLKEELSKQGYSSYSEVFLCLIETDQLFIIKDELRND